MIAILLFPSDRWALVRRMGGGKRRVYSLSDAPSTVARGRGTGCRDHDCRVCHDGVHEVLRFVHGREFHGVFIHAASSGLSAFFHCPRTWLAETANEAPINMGKDSDRRSRARCSPSGYGERVPLPRSTRFWNVPPIGRCAAPRAPPDDMSRSYARCARNAL